MFDTMAASVRDGMSGTRFVKAGLAIVGLILVVYVVTNLAQHVDANEIMVVQSPMGSLSVYTDPGIKWQGFGKVTFTKNARSFRSQPKRTRARKTTNPFP
jgi:hypothetical protein